MHKFILWISFLFLPAITFSQNVVLNSTAGKSSIKYELRHPTHNVIATSKELQVKIEYDKEKNAILNAIAQIKVSSFDSGNSNRDSHAMELIEAMKYPLAKFRSGKIVDNGDSLTIYGDLTFHNVTKNITIKAKKWINSNILAVKGSFAISLDEFKVERPTLLFIPTEEYLRFEFYCEFNIK